MKFFVAFSTMCTSLLTFGGFPEWLLGRSAFSSVICESGREGKGGEGRGG